VIIIPLKKINGHNDSLGPHQVLVFEGRPLQVDDSLSPQRDMKDPPYLDIHLGRAKDHHVVVLHTQTYTHTHTHTQFVL